MSEIGVDIYMQLKRATEFSLRYLICLAHVQSHEGSRFVTFSELNSEAQLTRKQRPSETSRLFDSDWVSRMKCGIRVGYRLAVDADSITVYDTVCLIENTTDMRTSFLNDDYMMPGEIRFWSDIQDQLDDQMKEMTIKRLAAIHYAYLDRTYIK